MWIRKLSGVFCIISSYTRTRLPPESTGNAYRGFCATSQLLQMALAPCVEEPDFPQRILFTREAKFTREGVINFRNSQVWADENPHATPPSPQGFQQRCGFNMWAGLLEGCVIEPYLLPPNLTGVKRTWISFNTYCMGSWKIWHCMCVKPCDSARWQTWIGHGGPIACLQDTCGFRGRPAGAGYGCGCWTIMY